MGVSRPNCDLVNFSQYVSKNLQLYELSNDGSSTGKSSQRLCARDRLRSMSFWAGTAKRRRESLYVMHYMGSLVEAKYGAQGYTSNYHGSQSGREVDEGRAVVLIAFRS